MLHRACIVLQDCKLPEVSTSKSHHSYGPVEGLAATLHARILGGPPVVKEEADEPPARPDCMLYQPQHRPSQSYQPVVKTEASESAGEDGPPYERHQKRASPVIHSPIRPPKKQHLASEPCDVTSGAASGPSGAGSPRGAVEEASRHPADDRDEGRW